MKADEHRLDILLIALVVSIIVHVGVMIYARPKVMTRIASGIARVVHRGPMKVDEREERPEPRASATVADAEASREEPKAEGEEVSVPSAEVAKAIDALKVAAPDVGATAAGTEPAVAQEVFEVNPMKIDDIVSMKMPTDPVETPEIGGGASGIPTDGGPEFTKPTKVPELITAGPDVDSLVLRAPVLPELKDSDRIVDPDNRRQGGGKGGGFVPLAEVLDRVDERIVEREKSAVRDLVNAAAAVELARFVEMSMSVATEGDWTYFKVYISPRSGLNTVQKDVVVLLDASGSIGRDRIGSIRAAAKKILRSAANTGDRFNLVAFRDRFSYAFRRWQECTQESFDRADVWLNGVAPFGRTDVFATISSVLTLPRDPERPLIALVVTDGEANSGVSDTAQILSKFTALNDGLISVYMYGVKSSANRELIDVLTRGNRGESFIHEGSRWKAGVGIEGLSERFRDPVLSDLRIVFSTGTRAEAYPRMLRNLYRGGVLEVCGRVPASTRKVAFSLKGLNGAKAYEGFFSLDVASAAKDASVARTWREEQAIDLKLRKE